MSDLIHVQTVISTTFGTVEDGELVRLPPIESPSRFSAEGFAEAHQIISDIRDQAIAAQDSQEPGVDDLKGADLDAAIKDAGISPVPKTAGEKREALKAVVTA